MREKMGGPFIDLTFTSPPYNVSQDYDTVGDNLPYGDYLTTITDVLMELRKSTVVGGRLVLNSPEGVNAPGGRAKKGYYPVQHDLYQCAIRAGWLPHSTILWFKQTIYKRTAWGSWLQASNPSIMYSWEYLLVFYNQQRRLEPNGQKHDITADENKRWTDGFWHISPESRKLGHPCPFPEELAYRVIKLFCYPGMTVCDPFAGVGTTLAVAKGLKRRWVGIDASLKYVEMSKRRVDAVDPATWVPSRGPAPWVMDPNDPLSSATTPRATRSTASTRRGSRARSAGASSTPTPRSPTDGPPALEPPCSAPAATSSSSMAGSTSPPLARGASPP